VTEGIGTLDSVHYVTPYAGAVSYSGSLVLSTLESSIFVRIRNANATQGTGDANEQLDVIVPVGSSDATVLDLRKDDLGIGVPTGLAASSGTLTTELNEATGNELTPSSYHGLVLEAVVSDSDTTLAPQSTFYANYRLNQGSHGASLTSKGRSALGTDFRVGAMQINTAAVNDLILSIQATENDTQIDLSSLDGLGLTFVNPSSTAFATDGNKVITLQRGQSFVIDVQDDDQTTPELVEAIIGKAVTSDKPIVVSSGFFNGAPLGTSNTNC
jgi:hypothetical protein